jgi:peroxiredoxin
MSGLLARLLLLAFVSLPGFAAKDPRLALWMFGRTLQSRQLAQGEAAPILNYLTLLERRPDLRPFASGAKYMMTALSVGKVAPEITGRDLGGARFSLSDYRGKVVVLLFSGDWCGICRAQYPIERRLQELEANGAPVVVLSVDSGASAAESRAALSREGLRYRAWWDGGGDKPTSGPIATQWNVVGWPATYVIDEHGVIRYVDLLQDDLIKAVEVLIGEGAGRLPLAQPPRAG